MESVKKPTLGREECLSCGACWAIYPEFFEQDTYDTFDQVAEGYRTGGLGQGVVM